MARIVTPLTDMKCRQAKYSEEGSKKLFDGGGLYLELKPSGAKKWRMKFRQPNGKENTLSFGDYPTTSLQAAREQREIVRQQIAQGMNPATEREIAKQALIQSNQDTFKAIATEWLELKESEWSAGYHQRVGNALKANIYPALGQLPIARITGLLVLTEIKKVEQRGALEMASRVLEAVSMVFKYATGTGRATADVTAGLVGFLKTKPPVQHFPHVSLGQLPEMLHAVEHYHGRRETIFALKLMMRTFPRTSELRWARWDEFDLQDGLWTIPAARMKGRKIAKKFGEPHWIPLSRQVVELLKDLQRLTGRYQFLFPGARNPGTAPMSAETMNKALKIMGYEGEQTGHGFRGLASTLLNESGLFRWEAIDSQLAHKRKNKTEAAYNHAEYLRERRAILQWWSDFLDTQLELGAVTKAAGTHTAPPPHQTT